MPFQEADHHAVYRRLSMLSSALTFTAHMVTDFSDADGLPSSAAQRLQLCQPPFTHVGQCEGLAYMQEAN